MYESSFFKIITGSFTCTCLAGYSGDGKTCLPLPDKPMDIKVTAINPNEVTVTWYVANDTIIRYFTVEYKWLDKEWQFVKIQPNRTQAHLKDLDSDSSYLVRIGKSCDYGKQTRATCFLHCCNSSSIAMLRVLPCTHESNLAYNKSGCCEYWLLTGLSYAGVMPYMGVTSLTLRR